MNSPRDNRITMGDIAKQAGVSRPTVSLALRNDPRLPLKTRQRIQQLAEEMGYRRDPAFDVLAMHRWQNKRPSSYSITMLTRSTVDPLIAKGAKAEAQRLGLGLDLMPLDYYKDPSDLSRTLKNRGVRGLLLPLITSHEEIQGIDWDEFSVVAYGLDAVFPQVHRVQIDFGLKFAQAWQIVLERGYQRIGLASLFKTETQNTILMNGIARHYQHAFLDPENRIPLFEADFHDYDDFTDWYYTHLPEVIIGSHPAIPGWIEAEQLRMPEDVAMLCLYLNEHQKEYVTHFGSVPNQIGSRAVQLIDQMIKSNERGLPEQPITISIPPVFAEGTTLPHK